MDFKRYFLSLSVALVCVVSALAASPGAETLDYKVMFKWGLINKQAGTVRITCTDPDSRGDVKARLTAKSASWADRFYKLRDTLSGTLDARTFTPSRYEKISHEGGEYKRDLITYAVDGSDVTANCSRWRRKKEGKPVTYSTVSHEATGFYVDMVSAFYYMRFMDYGDLAKGHGRNMTIFSGRRKEKLSIIYNGLENVSYDGRDYRCYAITFTFTSTSDGKTKTSDDLRAWITADSRRIPVMMIGKLPVGSVKCFYTGK